MCFLAPIDKQFFEEKEREKTLSTTETKQNKQVKQVQSTSAIMTAPTAADKFTKKNMIGVALLFWFIRIVMANYAFFFHGLKCYGEPRSAPEARLQLSLKGVDYIFELAFNGLLLLLAIDISCYVGRQIRDVYRFFIPCNNDNKL